MKKHLLAILVSLWCLPMAYGQNPTNNVDYFDSAIPERADKEFQFFAFFINQGVTSNYFPTNDFLKGQIIGRLFGQNTTSTSDTSITTYFEQRLLPFFIYQPKLFNSKVILRTSFEIDYTWGDVAYGVGGNFGGAVSADQVNIQTQNVEVEFLPGRRWAINLGLQRMFDSPFNAYRTNFDKMTYTGYRLAYWGTDAVGISVRKDWDFAQLKGGYYQLYENNVQEKDDVVMYELMYARYLTPKWNVGVSANYVNDRANGEGGPSILGQGLNATLNDYNGTFRFRGLGNYKADIMWLGAFFHRNEDQMMDPWVLSGFVKYNLGNVRERNNQDIYTKKVSVGGVAANLRAAYRYGQTSNDHVSIDVLFASGDDNGIADGKYSGVITGNTWGSPTAIFISSGAYILFPHGNVVNRFTAAVNDLSNIGFGLVGGTVNLSKDFIPHKVNGKVGLAQGFSAVAPRNGGSNIGTEFNAKIAYNFGPFMSLEAHGAYMVLGDFYDSRQVVPASFESRPVNPWTAFLVFKWLMF